jgi:hypothetical protein
VTGPITHEEHQAIERLDRLSDVIARWRMEVDPGAEYAAKVAQEIATVGTYLLDNPRPVVQPHVSYEGDDLAALRMSIDERIERLGTGFEDEDEDPILALVADLIEYRVALWDEPAGYVLAEPTKALWQQDQAVEEALGELEQVLSDEPVIVPASELAHVDHGLLLRATHLHSTDGACLKHRSGPPCNPAKGMADHPSSNTYAGVAGALRNPVKGGPATHVAINLVVTL